MTPFQEAYLPFDVPSDLKDDQTWLNDVYQVNERNFNHPTWGHVKHLSIKRIDKEARPDWRDFQWIKNQLAGPEIEAIELYPAESRLIDTANQYHLWCAMGGHKFPVGWDDRIVSESEEGVQPGTNCKQRKFAPHVRPCDLVEQEQALQAKLRLLRYEMEQNRLRKA